MEVVTPTKRRMVERGLSWPRHEEFWLTFIKKSAKELQSSSFDRLQLNNRNPLVFALVGLQYRMYTLKVATKLA